MRFVIDFSREARRQLRGFTVAEQRRIVEAITQNLQHQANVASRHRKPLRENPLAPWELRVGEVRVFYNVLVEEQSVYVVAIGRKGHNRLRIGDQETEL